MIRLSAIFLLAFGALAQTSPAPMKIGDVTVQGSFRSRLEMWDWFRGAANNDYAFSGNILRLSLGQTKKTFEWQIELAAPFLLSLPEDAIAPGAQGNLGLGGNYYAANSRSRNAGMVFPKNAFIRFKHGTQSVRIGRFEFSDGAEVAPANATLGWVKRERISQRLIGPFAWSHTGRSFDGAHYAWNSKKTNVTLMGALATRGAFQVDAWGNLKTAVGYAALTRQETWKNHNADWRVFGIYYHDWRDVVKTDTRPLALRRLDMDNIRIGSFGGHYIHRAGTAAGDVDLLLWGVAQTGRWGLLDHRGEAVAVEGGWQPMALPKLKPWLRVGYFRGSGDDNPLDSKHGTFFQILPTPRPYARMPFFDLINNEDFLAMLMLRPHKALTIRSEAHGLRLTNRNDMWYQGGGAFQPWTFGYIGRPSNGNRGLATLYDVSTEWTVNPHAALTGYYAHAVGQSVIRSIYPAGKNGSFGYVELLLRF